MNSKNQVPASAGVKSNPEAEVKTDGDGKMVVIKQGHRDSRLGLQNQKKLSKDGCGY